MSVVQPSIIGKSNGIVNQGTFNFYDGKITAKIKKDGQTLEGKRPVAINGEPNELPIAYSVSIEDDDKEDEQLQIATLTIISEIEAKIGTVTYTKLEEAVEAARNTFWS